MGDLAAERSRSGAERSCEAERLREDAAMDMLGAECSQEETVVDSNRWEIVVDRKSFLEKKTHGWELLVPIVRERMRPWTETVGAFFWVPSIWERTRPWTGMGGISGAKTRPWTGQVGAPSIHGRIRGRVRSYVARRRGRERAGAGGRCRRWGRVGGLVTCVRERMWL